MVRIAHRRIGAGTLGLASTAALALSAPGAHADALISTAPPCNGNYNPYSYTAAALSQCGVSTTPVSSITPLADGIDDYAYDLPSGVVFHLYDVPAGFDPSTLSASERHAFGVSGTLTNPLASNASGTVSVPAPPPFVVPNPATSIPATTANSPWAGWLVDNGAANHFTSAGNSYWQPSIGASACPSSAVSTWVGIGGNGSNDLLGQDGTEREVSIPGQPTAPIAFAEVVKGTPTDFTNYLDEALPGLNPVANDFMATTVAWQSSPEKYSGTVADETQDSSNVVPWSATNLPAGVFTGDTVESITEAPVFAPSVFPPSGRAPLSNFGTMYYFNTTGNGNDISSDANREPLTMTDSNNVVQATPSGLGVPGLNGLSTPSTFSVHQSLCS